MTLRVCENIWGLPARARAYPCVSACAPARARVVGRLSLLLLPHPVHASPLSAVCSPTHRHAALKVCICAAGRSSRTTAVLSLFHAPATSCPRALRRCESYRPAVRTASQPAPPVRGCVVTPYPRCPRSDVGQPIMSVPGAAQVQIIGGRICRDWLRRSFECGMQGLRL